MNLIEQGLMISLIGLITAFLTMGIFIFIILGLRKVFPAPPKSDAEPSIVTSIILEDGEEEALVAAISAVVLAARSQSQKKLGKELTTGRGTWWSSNLTKAMRS